MVKVQFEADLIGSFERTRNHGIRWKGFSPEGALNNVDLSVPSEECTRALRQEMNYMVAHALHRHSESLVNELERVAHRVVQEVIKNQYSPSFHSAARGSLAPTLAAEAHRWSSQHSGLSACRCRKWATTKLLDCSFVVRLIRYGLARKDSRI